MRFLLIVLTLLFFKSCSLVKPKEQSTYLTSAQLNLVRTSYMKGCLDAKNIILKQKKAYSYDQCRELAELHEKSIKDILEFEEKK